MIPGASIHEEPKEKDKKKNIGFIHHFYSSKSISNGEAKWIAKNKKLIF